ncbi:MAG: hypothetical protein U0796_09560 [Gemmatales bacterium]
MSRVSLPMSPPRRMGETLRQDRWWVQPIIVVTILTSFIVYATWAAFQNAYYTYGPYLSPFYSPELWGNSPHAWFGPKPAWWPGWLPFSPALIILPFPAFFRFTCYYYRGAYYKAFWSDPPSCAVGEWRSGYLGEKYLPLVLQNIHRYFLYFAILFIGLLAWDAIQAFIWTTNGVKSFGIGVGTLVLCLNVVLLGGYTFGCHSFRHLVGGLHDLISKHPLKKKVYDCSTCLNQHHHKWAWMSLFSVAFSDIYIRMCSMGIWTDLRII